MVYTAPHNRNYRPKPGGTTAPPRPNQTSKILRCSRGVLNDTGTGSWERTLLKISFPLRFLYENLKYFSHLFIFHCIFNIFLETFDLENTGNFGFLQDRPPPILRGPRPIREFLYKLRISPGFSSFHANPFIEKSCPPSNVVQAPAPTLVDGNPTPGMPLKYLLSKPLLLDMYSCSYKETLKT